MIDGTIVVLVLGFIFIALICFVSFREWAHQKQLNELTNKLMSRDFTEYTVMTRKETPKKEQPKKKPVDPILGGLY